MSQSTAESGSTTRDSRGLVAALTTDAQAFGHKPNGRHISNYFFLENIGVSQNAWIITHLRQTLGDGTPTERESLEK